MLHKGPCILKSPSNGINPTSISSGCPGAKASWNPPCVSFQRQRSPIPDLAATSRTPPAPEQTLFPSPLASWVVPSNPKPSFVPQFPLFPDERQPPWASFCFEDLSCVPGVKPVLCWCLLQVQGKYLSSAGALQGEIQVASGVAQASDCCHGRGGFNHFLQQSPRAHMGGTTSAGPTPSWVGLGAQVRSASQSLVFSSGYCSARVGTHFSRPFLRDNGTSTEQKALFPPSQGHYRELTSGSSALANTWAGSSPRLAAPGAVNRIRRVFYVEHGAPLYINV